MEDESHAKLNMSGLSNKFALGVSLVIGSSVVICYLSGGLNGDDNSNMLPTRFVPLTHVPTRTLPATLSVDSADTGQPTSTYEQTEFRGHELNGHDTDVVSINTLQSYAGIIYPALDEILAGNITTVTLVTKEGQQYVADIGITNTLLITIVPQDKSSFGPGFAISFFVESTQIEGQQVGPSNIALTLVQGEGDGAAELGNFDRVIELGTTNSEG